MSNIPDELKELTHKEFSAFIAFFRCPMPFITRYFYNGEQQGRCIAFGKAECEWISYDTWEDKFSALGLIRVSNIEKGNALGKGDGWTYQRTNLEPTEKGLKAYNDYYDNLRKSYEDY